MSLLLLLFFFNLLLLRCSGGFTVYSDGRTPVQSGVPRAITASGSRLSTHWVNDAERWHFHNSGEECFQIICCKWCLSPVKLVHRRLCAAGDPPLPGRPCARAEPLCSTNVFGVSRRGIFFFIIIIITTIVQINLINSVKSETLLIRYFIWKMCLQEFFFVFFF